MKIGKTGKVILTEDNELITLDGREVSDDEIRVDEAGPDTVKEPAREIPVAWDVDVIVAGGGISGVFAAIAAGRLRCSTDGEMGSLPSGPWSDKRMFLASTFGGIDPLFIWSIVERTMKGRTMKGRTT